MGPEKKEPANLYTLSFKFTLKHDDDEVYIAMCYPYTYSMMQNFISEITSPPEAAQNVRLTPLCKTIAGNSIPMLLITNFNSSQDEIALRKCVVLTGRVHPGETNSSFVVEGLI